MQSETADRRLLGKEVKFFSAKLKLESKLAPNSLANALASAVGTSWDGSKFKAYPAGTFYSEPAKAPHFTWAKDGEVIIQVTGVGPTGKTFIPQPK